MTTQEITNAINSTFPVDGDFAKTLGQLALQAQLKQLDLEIDALNVKRAEVVKPIEDERIELNNQRLELIATLKPPK